MKNRTFAGLLIFIFLLFQLGGCASGRRAYLSGEDLTSRGEYDAAVRKFFEAVRKDPDSHEYRAGLQNARMKAAWEHLAAGRNLAEKGDNRGAMSEFEQAAALDPTNDSGRQEVKKMQDRLRAEDLLKQAQEFYQARKFPQAKNALDEALLLYPGWPPAQQLLAKVQEERGTVLDGFELDVASDKPITLKFRDADVREVFNILSKLSGINFIFDDDVRAQKISILLEKATFAQTLELLLRLNSLEKKVLNSKTILIYPQTREKEKKYEDQVIQIFYLSNIEAKKAVNLLRTMLQLRKIYVHEELNAVVIRETPQVVKLAQQVLEAADRPDSEVVFELELVEVSHVDNLDIGPRLSSYGTTFGLAQPGSDTISDSLTTSGLSKLNFLYTVPSGTFSFQKKLSDSEILANPKIRVKNKEKAKVHIGSREPIITNTLTASGDVTSTNVQYVDVGVKLDVEPTIQLDNTVVAKISLEVSSVSGREKIGSSGQGGEALTISTTNAQTSLILRDGKQTVIGGLMRDDVTKAKDTFPLLGRLPLIGSLISGHKRDKTKREILLSITPHIVKNLDMPRPDVATIWSGGEDDLEAGPRFGAFARPLEPEAAKRPPAVAPAVQPTAAAPAGVPAVLTVPGAGELAAEVPVGEGSAVQPALAGVPLAPEAPPGAEAAAIPAGEAPPDPSDELPAGGTPVPEEAAPVPGSETAPETTAVPPAGAPETPPPLPFPGPAEETAAGKVMVNGLPQLRTGEEFPFEVVVQGVKDLYSSPLFVTYDPQRLEFVRAEEGDFLKTGGRPTIFSTSADPGSGQLIVGYKQGAGGAGVSGSGTLFYLVFRGKSPGTARIALERLNFRDPAGSRLPVTGGETTVEVR